jgi:hypothetical protein
LLFLTPLVSYADIINENFSGLTPTLNATNVGAFTVIGGSVDVVGAGLFGNLIVAPESGNVLDLDGSTEAAGTITSANFTLTPGTYQLSFDLIGSQRGVMTSTTVTLGSLYDNTFALASDDVTNGIVSQIFTVDSTTVESLIFASNTPGDIGALLDNVDLKSTSTSAVSEPDALSLIVLGLACLMIARRYRHASR